MRTYRSEALHYLSSLRLWWVPLIVSGVLLATSIYNYLLFHTLTESFTIMVGVTSFVVIWHTYRFTHNHFLMYIGCGYACVAMLDMLHALLFTGMQIFPGYGTNATVQVWVAVRYLEAFILVTAPIFLTRMLNRVLVVFCFGITSAILGATILAGYFPDAFIEGQGLTRFKIVSEYIIIFILVAAILVLLSRRQYLNIDVLRPFVLSVVMTICAELSFTLYIDIYGIANLMGHIFKLISFWLIFYAIVYNTLTKPYHMMATGFNTYEAIPTPIVVIDQKGIIHQTNKAASKIRERFGDDILGHHCHGVFHDPGTSIEQCPVCSSIARERPLSSFEIEVPGRQQWLECSIAPIQSVEGIMGMIHVAVDVTERKLFVAKLEQSNRALLTLNACNAVLIHAKNERNLLSNMCQVIVAQGGYPAVWVGTVIEEGGNKSIRLIASIGFDEGYIESLDLQCPREGEEKSPTCRVFCNAKTEVARDVLVNLAGCQDYDNTQAKGYASVISLPILDKQNNFYATLNIYSCSTFAFSDEEIDLLEKMSTNLAFGIQLLKTRSERDKYQRDYLAV